MLIRVSIMHFVLLLSSYFSCLTLSQSKPWPPDCRNICNCWQFWGRFQRRGCLKLGWHKVLLRDWASIGSWIWQFFSQSSQSLLARIYFSFHSLILLPALSAIALIFLHINTFEVRILVTKGNYTTDRDYLK